MKTTPLAIILLLGSIGIPACRAQDKPPLTNNDIIEMSKAGLGDGIIMTAIETNKTQFDTNIQALIKLKNSGVSDGVLSAMQKSGVNLLSTRSAGYPGEWGIYADKDGQLTELGAEPVNYRAGGAAEKFLTGMDKGHTNGVVNGAHSEVHVSPRNKFVLVTFEGFTPSEYLLVRLEEKKNIREFREETVHVFSKPSGPGRSAIQFSFHRLAPRTYQIETGDLPAGEYGFLPPVGLDNKYAQANGRIFTFSVE